MSLFELTPKEKVQKAIAKVGTERSFFGHLVFSLKHEADDSIPTANINRMGKMRYNPDFFDRMEVKHAKTIVTHEIMHPAFSHFDRCGSRNPKIWNYATDLAINSTLKQEGFEFPSVKEIYPEEIADIIEEALGSKETTLLVPDSQNNFDFGAFVIENCHEKSAEEMYDEIKDQMPEIKIKINMQGQGSGQGQGGSGDSDSEDSKEDQDNQESSGSGSASGTEQDNGQGGGSPKVTIEVDGQETDLDDVDDISDIDGLDDDMKVPVPIDVHDHSEEPEGASGEEVEDREREIEQAKRKAMSHAKQRGDLPSGIEMEINSEQQSQINWKQVLQRFITNSLPHDYTFERPNRRYRHRGIYLPSEKRESIEVYVALDNSMSISEEELEEFVGELYGILNGYANVDMTIIQHDADVQKVDKIEDRSDLEGFGIRGRGGTDHRPVFEWLKENDRQARVLVSLTDGFTVTPDKSEVPNTLNCLWVVNNYKAEEERMPYGKIIRQPSKFLEESDI